MESIIAGRRAVIEALKGGTRIEKILFLRGVKGKIVDVITSMAEHERVQVVHVSKQQFRDLVSDTTTQGVVAVLQATKRYVGVEQILHTAAARQEQGFILILDEIEDPHNLGALVRTAECTGVHGVIIPKHHAASFSTTVVKASAGATEHIAMAEVINIVHCIEELKEKGFWIVGLDAAGDKLYTGIDYAMPTALVVGNEGKGIRRLVRERCDHLVKIPLYGKVASLNASVAGALVMYEVAKQRRGWKRSED
jgi:23S rRNA (guanosine2251-2'-O)-methyltransferase